MRKRMYAVENVDEVVLEYDLSTKMYIVTTPTSERIMHDPRDAWIEYSTSIANYVLKNISNKLKAKETINNEPSRTGRADSAL